MEELQGNINRSGQCESEEERKTEIMKPKEAELVPDEEDTLLEGQAEAEIHQIGYDSFVGEIYGCLNELRKSQDGSANESSDRETTPLVTPDLVDVSAVIQQPGNVLHNDDNGTSSVDGPFPPGPGINGLNEAGLGYGACLGVVRFEGSSAEVKQSCQAPNGDIAASSDQVSPDVPGVNDMDAGAEQSGQTCNAHHHEQKRQQKNASTHVDNSAYLIRVYSYVNHTEVSCLADWTVRVSEIDKFLSELKTNIPAFQRRFMELDIQLPIPQNLGRHRWLAKSAQKFKLGTSGFSYEGDIMDKKMHGYGRIVLGDSSLFIEGYWSKNRLMEMKFCQLTSHCRSKTIFIVKRPGDYLLTVYENNFVARVMLDSLEELDFTANVSHLKTSFFKKLTTLEILVDELEYQRQVALTRFESLLKNMTGEDADPIIRANVLVLLSKHSDLNELCYQTIPADLHGAAKNLLDSEARYLNDSFMKSILHTPQVKQLDIRQIMSKISKEGIERHRQTLISKCPKALPTLLSELQILEDLKVVYVTSADIDVFDHLVSQPSFEQYKAYFEHLVERFCHALYKIRAYTQPSSVIPIMSPVYGFLFKSFWEIISEIIEIAEGCQYEDLLHCESGGWKLRDSIKWPDDESEKHTYRVRKFFRSSDRKSSLHHKSLDTQYKIIFHMLKQFSPENYAANKKGVFKFEVLEQNLSFWKKGLKMVSNSVGLVKRLKNVPEERVVWLYILDHTIHNVFKDDSKYHVLLKPYNSLFQGQISFIEKSQTECHESFRMLTHSIIRFVISTAPYFQDTQGKSGIDVEILVQQMWTFSTASQDIERDPLAFSNFRDLIAEYNRYLSLRLYIDVDSAPGYFSVQISDMMHTFMRIVKNSVNKKLVPTTALVGYFRSLNEFLDDFKNIDFLAMWYVKSLFYYPEIMEKVDNKLCESEHCSYRVTDIGKYVQVLTHFRQQPPDHYIILIVHTLLRCIETCLNKQWQSEGDGSLPVVQLKSTGVLLDAVRRSFMYLKEQPDYVDFEAFKKESVDPFSGLVEKCTTLSDLKKRIDIVKESFWYIRNMDEIGIDQALTRFKNANTCLDSDCEKLLHCYELYRSHYEEYISQYSSLLSEGNSHEESMDTVRGMLQEHDTTLHFSKWTEEFKTRDIPILLAALSAVWSILVSKDVSSAGKFLKPHCIQILCIMRLLSVDGSKGVDNHLAQVLTGQGKSVILGLLSSVLALTGHKVRVLCYSKYLSSRDQNDFEQFFGTFQITDKIEYGTFENMANSFLNPSINGIPTSLRQVVKDRVLNHTDCSSMGPATSESENTVLLIDEVDVFFSEKFYGKSYGSCDIIGIDGLADVHEKIWSLATNMNLSFKEIVQHTKYIADEVVTRNSSMLKLNEFLNKRGTFSLLKEFDNVLSVVEYTRPSLFYEHLELMASCACLVARPGNDWSRSGFILNSQDVICKEGHDNIYSQDCYSSYLNVFNYFRLKRSNFDSKNFQNYGYLLLHTGNISYARLPSQFKLILGVSGTINNLDVYEKREIESYNIRKTSILPSFFGLSNLKFNKEADFRYFHKVHEWLKEIYRRANQIVESHRAVMIFFESDSTMNLFKKEYKAKFDRLNEITVNTDKNRRDVYINEAGLSSTVTLATRDMGRGVDYKSSWSVEKKGGVHVIQTFYSVDVKEETQIKGRTARKDNKGSYEMMICRDHLIENSIITEDDVTTHSYSSLETIRRYLSYKKGKILTENIEKSEANHITTMNYFGLA